jgi:hypothetical protein
MHLKACSHLDFENDAGGDGAGIESLDLGGFAMRSLVWCAFAVALVLPTASQAQSTQQKADLATKLLAIVKQAAQPNSGQYSVAGTATVGGQTKVYLQQEFDLSGKKRHVNSEYLCTLLDDGAGWMCANATPATQPSLLFVK